MEGSDTGLFNSRSTISFRPLKRKHLSKIRCLASHVTLNRPMRDTVNLLLTGTYKWMIGIPQMIYELICTLYLKILYKCVIVFLLSAVNIQFSILQLTAFGLHGMNGHLVLKHVETVQDHKKGQQSKNQPTVEGPVTHLKNLKLANSKIALVCYDQL